MTQIKNNGEKIITMRELERRRDFAINLCRDACTIIKKDFKIGIEKKHKKDSSIDGATDIKINEMFIKEIRKEFPTHDILSEERSYLKNRSVIRWVCDPLDGTRVFSQGVPTSMISIAVVEIGVPLLGVVYDPFMDRMFSAIINNGARLNGESIHVSSKKIIKEASVGISYWNGAQISLTNLHTELIEASSSVLMLGSIVYMGALVSCGELDALIHPAKYPYDSAALSVIISEAGGTVTGISGNKQKYDRSINGGVMTNRILHNDLLDMIRKTNK